MVAAKKRTKLDNWNALPGKKKSINVTANHPRLSKVKSETRNHSSKNLRPYKGMPISGKKRERVQPYFTS